MADYVGIYAALWRPDENGLTHARQLIPLLEKGLERLRGDRKPCEQFNSSNGWGTWEGLVHFVEEYLAACRAYPDAEISISR